jgi:lipopolysaccharide biosynthesis glycosyltransferase
MDRMNVCICFSPDWREYVLVQMFALFTNNPCKIKVYLISDGLEPIDLSYFESLCRNFGNECEYFDLNDFFTRKIGNKNVHPRFTKYTLFRLSIPFLIGDDRVLYLDADTLVVGDIREMYFRDMDKLIYGAVDTGINKNHRLRVGIKQDSTYVNGGVLLFDLKKVRDGRYGERWLELAKIRRFPIVDQDIVNLTLQGKIGEIGPEYNCSLSTSLVVDDVKIHHFAGPKQPWIEKLPNYHVWKEWENLYEVSDKRACPEFKELIPRVIYYGWFGGKPKPQNVLDCIDSWSVTGYEIVELNESNCDVRETQFTSDAYDQGKFAYVADYFRMKAMYEHGGITLDGDVRLVRTLDRFLAHRFFSGQEINEKVLITATMGSEKGHPLVKLILDYYNAKTFAPVPNTQFITELFKLFIQKRVNGKIILENDVHLYPQSYFCSFDHKKLRVIENQGAFAYHLFNGSWKK